MVIDEIKNFLSNNYGTVHRGIYDLSITSTNCTILQERKFNILLNHHQKEHCFTRGTTDSINLAAFGYVKEQLNEGDEILITEIEHHANFVPWQQIANQKKATVVYAPIEDSGELDLNKFNSLINKKTKFIAITHISNVLGTILPIASIIEKAKQKKSQF